MLRINCVVCNKNDLIEVFNLISTIDMVSLVPYENKELFELNFVGCKNCGCVQLKKLFDPDKIYEQPIQCVDGPILTKHHELFAEFVFNRTNYHDELFEIGGSYGKIANKIINKYKEHGKSINYKILEFNTDYYPEIENIEYIKGNCETYNFNETKIIIMSHVFEHLYEPRKFINKIQNENVQDVFISIPDMENLMKNGDINNLNIFHTFYLDTPYLVYMFKLYGYVIKTIFNYKESSVFYHFKLNKKEAICNLSEKIKRPELLENIQNFYHNIKTKINNIKINEKFFICPAGFYGRNVYNYLESETKQNSIGFLDSDNFKIDKRLSGTPLFVYDKKYISNFDKINVLICSEKHKNELTNELLNYNKNIKFIYL
jgi:hypothetical protein